MDYKKSGVNIEAGEESVKLIKPLVKKTFNKNVLADIGLFGGLYEIDLSKWKKPVMVASTDGVGTKLVIAQMTQRYDTVGQCLVNHCVNDIFVQGAEPQFFLDYYGVGKLKPENVEKVIQGMAQACIENEMCLIGGEMAEMPSIYEEDEFDLAGTIVGLVEKENIITGKEICEHDLIIGFPSNGLHTNGYSLARKIIFDVLKYEVNQIIPDLGLTVAEALLKVHRSYYPMLKKWATPEFVHGMAHITGGGIKGNLKRSIPEGYTAQIDRTTWRVPHIYKFLQQAGKVETEEMYSAFNMGIGFMLIVPQHHVGRILEETDGFLVGSVRKANGEEPKVVFV